MKKKEKEPNPKICCESFTPILLIWPSLLHWGAAGSLAFNRDEEWKQSKRVVFTPHGMTRQFCKRSNNYRGFRVLFCLPPLSEQDIEERVNSCQLKGSTLKYEFKAARGRVQIFSSWREKEAEMTSRKTFLQQMAKIPNCPKLCHRGRNLHQVTLNKCGDMLG